MKETVLITGASSGIGRETAYIYAKNKYNLVLVARRKNELEIIKQDIKNLHKVNVSIFDMDLSKLDSAELLYKVIKNAKLNIDILINNAGFGISGDFKDIDINKEESMLILNIISLTKLTKLFLKDMLMQKSGHIINIASTAAFQGVPDFATYAASKAYVLHFSEALAEELRTSNIKVSAICPGATQSEFAKTAETNSNIFDKAPTSHDLAVFIFKSMKKGKVTAIEGLKNNILVLIQRTAPRKLITKIAGKFME